MSKHRVQCLLVAGNSADALTVRSSLETDLAGRDVFDSGLEVDALAVLCHARFELPADAGAFYDRIVDLWTSGTLRNRILAGSRASRHVCPHDEAAWYNCRDDARAAYTETVKV
jgi:hypothetical protein